jgi:hypothetical protein
MVVLIWTLLSSGCGGSDDVSNSVGTSLKGRSSSPELRIESPVVQPKQRTPAKFVCKENQIWLPLEIEGVPDNAAELVLATTRSRFHRHKNETRAELVSMNLVGGLRPEDQRLEVGATPSRAFWRMHGLGLCPSRPGTSGFVFVVYALPQDYSKQLRKIRILYPPELDELEEMAIGSASLPVLYKR